MGQGVLSEGAAALSAEALAALFADAGLVRERGELVMAGVRLADVADAVGTPAFVYNAEAIRARFRALDAALAPLPHRICFAVKANSNLAVLRLFRDLGAGADIVSVGELRRALAAGFEPARVVFSGVGKTAAELREAVCAGIGHVNVESREELELLARIADEERHRVSVGIRVNPDVTAETHPYISTGSGAAKFGIPYDQVAAAAAFVRDSAHLELTSLAMHLGSQLVDPAPFGEGIRRLRALLDEVRALGVDTVRVIDIGGGLGIRYAEEPAMDPARFAEVVVPLLEPTGLTVYVEPGRFLVGSAGVLLGEVLYRKHSGGKGFVVLDAGMNELVRPSRYQAYHAIVELAEQGRRVERVDVVGPICETGDFLALDRPLPGLAAGERVAILGAGAYGFVMSSNYNTRVRPAEVLVDGGRWAVARPRETLDALFRDETPTPFAMPLPTDETR
ncbi:MAG TPA: diaminopimelate decarboxylase [Gemmatimonadales bacterium]|nr:diaminopimelate decarboxylase [Gemmatimonadales bacterium]